YCIATIGCYIPGYAVAAGAAANKSEVYDNLYASGSEAETITGHFEAAVSETLSSQ
ncbi:MAG: hypothetical protein Q9169_007721, partial [Polycauliona sp. 2 TL-2023]